MSMRLLLALAAGVFTVAGCEQPAPLGVYPPVTPDAQGVPYEFPVMIDTDQRSYPISGRVSLRLVNRTGRLVRYDLCRSSLERFNNEGDWRMAREMLADNCTPESRTLGPGQMAQFSFTAETRAPPGQYRVHTKLEGLDGTRLDVISNVFMLTRDGD